MSFIDPNAQYPIIKDIDISFKNKLDDHDKQSSHNNLKNQILNIISRSKMYNLQSNNYKSKNEQEHDGIRIKFIQFN